METLILASFLLPFILLLGWKLEGKNADVFALTITGVSLLLNAISAYEFFRDLTPRHFAYATSAMGEVFGLNVSVASVLMGVTTIGMAFLLILYSVSYLSANNRGFPFQGGKGRFYGLFGVLTGSSMLFIYSTNLVQFALSLELMAIALLLLVNFNGNAKGEALRAFLVLNLGVLLIIMAIAKLGSGQVLYSIKPDNVALLLVIFASFAMSSQLFFYSWLPKATEGPLPVSAFVHSASIVPLGSFMLFRVIQYMRPDDSTFWVLGGLTVALILLMMIYYPLQSDAKKLIAYSTIAQTGVSYITLAYALLGHTVGLQIALYQVVNHAVVKALAFMSVGAFAYSLGTTELEKIRGIRKSLPWASTSWFLSFLGMAGVLPLGLFFSKAFTIMSTRHAKGIASWLFPGVVLFDAAIFLVVVLMWFREIFFGEPVKAGEEPTSMKVAMLILILVGIIAPWVTLDVVMKIGFAG